jgi:16S rRNA processing protein RimM
MNQDLYAIGAFLGGHGLKGEVKLTYFGDSFETLKQYEHVWLNAQTSLSFKSLRPFKGKVFIVSVEGITTRTQADALKGTQIFIHKDQLPILKEKDTFYTSTLIGCLLETQEGHLLGPLLSIENYGATDILEGSTFRVPFTKEAVLEVDLEKRRIIINASFVLYDE